MITAVGGWCRRQWATVVLVCGALTVGLWLGLTAPVTSPVSQLPSTAPAQRS